MTSIATAARRHALSRPVVREAFIELVATAFLLIAVVGSGIMAERLCGGNVGLALLANAIATGGALVALILAFGPQSGAHMNPVVTLAAAATEGLRWHAVPAYIAAQITGAILGVWLAHIMFDLPIWQLSQHVRTGVPQWVAEVIATFRPVVSDMGMPCVSPAGNGLCGRCLHHRGLLVYRLDVVRQPGRDHRAFAHRYLCWYPPD
jgi:glycerol uptake facilitator-like aquaporin